MKHFKHLWLSVLLGSAAMATAYAAPKYAYDSVPGDPLHTKIYTLPNGLKVFMTQNPREPRIQTYIAVRVGGKNDPAETTGLAHYFEHLMFKGTPNFGTVNYAAEKPLLDRIENLFETYRQTTDSVARAAIYHTIDSVSYEASKLAIPNEYDKMMSAIGANGTNAYTSTDVTCYVEDIPSNELERWAIVQADRFKNPVIRGFHTELETIYEEKNMSLTNDSRKSNEKMLAMLFPSHPYGTQTVLGTQTHLKNPSITNIKRYHDQWYVPNNMAIALSGDFDPDKVVDVITRYFGDMKPNPGLEAQRLVVTPEKPITTPQRAEVWGNEAERLTLAWRIPAAAHKDMLALNVMSNLLSNGTAGLMDLDLDQAQKLNGSGAGMYSMADQGAFLMIGLPRSGQSLQDVEKLLLGEVKKLQKGEFSDELLKAVVTNMELDVEKSLLDNSSRANYYVDAFVNGQPWAEAVKELDAVKKITKADVVAMANKYLGDNNYVAIEKRQGAPKDELKISKPAITPIVTNRDTASVFLTDFVALGSEPIEPKFVDFQKELTSARLPNGVELLYTRNPYNNLFDLTFVFETGSYADKYLSLAANYLDYLGTPDMTAAQVREAFYNLACEYFVSAGSERSYIVLRGLSENMTKAVDLLEKLINQAVADPAVYATFVETVLKSRADSKSRQGSNFSALRRYVTYGPDIVNDLMIKNEELPEINPEKLLGSLRDMLSLTHRVIYYGPLSLQQVESDLNEHHVKGVALREPAPMKKYLPIQPEETVVYVAPYDAKQLYMSMNTSNGESFDAASHPLTTLYNEYFGGSMNAIVFQEMREARSLAYSAWAYLNEPSRLDKPYTFMAGIATQNDKLMDAVGAFNSIINDMPRSEAAFALAKDGLEKRLRTNRVIDDNIAWAYINAQDLGLAPSLDGNGKNRSAGLDLDRLTFEQLPTLTLDDVVKFQQEKVKDRKYHYGILGKIEDLDMDALSKLGRVVILTPEQIFGY